MTQRLRDLEHALSKVFSGDMSVEAGCVMDALTDLGWQADDDPFASYMLGVLMRQFYEERHDRRPDYMLALDWVLDAWLPFDDPKRRELTSWAEALSMALDQQDAEVEP